MVIVVKGANCEELLERIGGLSESSIDDLKELIEGTISPPSEYDDA